MTGYALASVEHPRGALTLELRSVNARFLDLQLRVPSSMAAAESRIRSLVQSRVSRGRVEITVSVQQRRVPAVEVELNEPFLDALMAALERARERGYVEGAISASDLLRLPQALSIRERVDESPDEPSLSDVDSEPPMLVLPSLVLEPSLVLLLLVEELELLVLVDPSVSALVVDDSSPTAPSSPQALTPPSDARTNAQINR